MKNQKYSVAAGIVLFVLAALFSISLLLVAFDFGGINPAKNSLFYSLGKMFTGVYGLSSICIPIFLIVAGIQCFSAKWRLRNGVMLLGSVIPFFTLDAIEHICRMLLASDSDSVLLVKMSSTLLIGALILAAEYLLLSILGDVLENSLADNKLFQISDEPAQDETDDEADEEIQIFKAENEEENKNSGESKIDFSKDEIFLQQKEILKDLINDGKAAEETETEKNLVEDDQTVLEEPTIIENETLDESEANPDSVEEDEILEEDDFAEPELPEEPSPFEHIFDQQEKENEKEPEEPTVIEEELDSKIHDVTLPDFEDEEEPEEPTVIEEDDSKIHDVTLPDFEDEEEPGQDDDTIIQDDDALLSEMDRLYNDDEDLNEEKLPANSEDFQSDFRSEFDEMEDMSPVEFDEPVFDAEETNFDNEEESQTVEEIIEDSDFDEEPKFEAEEESQVAEEIIEDPDFDEAEEEINEPDEIEEEIKVPEEIDDIIEEPVLDDISEIREEESEEDFSEEDVDEESLGVEDIFSQMEADAAANPVVKNPEDLLPARDSLAQYKGANTETEAEAQKTTRKLSEYKIPTDLLEKFENDEYWRIDDETKAAGQNLKQTLNEFGIEAEVTGIRKGPVVTMFELLPAPGVKLSKIVNLQDNIALALAAKSVRIVAPIPGKHAVGIEIPNKERAIVSFREIIEQPLPEFKKMAVPVILGKDISGQSQIIDIAKTPHLLIAGATGAGKSVCVNSIILSILYNRSPNDVKLIMVDPKVVELKLYNDIPHLLTPVVTEPKRALQVLQYCICEMERRYALLDGMGVRDIVSYNTRIRERKIATEKLPYIVVIIDEFADLMATSGKELETNVARLTAMSRAVGIHLVLATQRPSVNVITGLIKANIPSRIAFMVASRTDSNIIIDSTGAEKLLGKGDMLYTSAVNPIPTRIQGTLVSDNEVENVVDYVKSFGGPDYIDDEIFVDDDEEEDNEPGLFSDGEDPLYDQALQIVVQAGKASASYIQRRLKIGYNRAARLVEDMEARGIVGPANGSKPREVIHMP